MSDALSYAPPVAIGELMVGCTVSRVEASRHNNFKVGKAVPGQSDWRKHRAYAAATPAASTPLARDA